LTGLLSDHIWISDAGTLRFIKRHRAPIPLNVVGAQVQKLRLRKGWTQDQLAIKLQLFGWDTSRESVAKLEKHRRRVPDVELFVLGKVLGIALEEIFPRNLRAKVKELGPYYRAKLSRGQVPPVPK
jgi:transcriptional regulator with XRE-family HTH domain